MNTNYKIPSCYFSGKFKQFQKLFETNGYAKLHFKKGSLLTTYGEVNNTAYFITKGVMRFALSHEKGVEKTIGFFGPYSLFPIGVERHQHTMDFEMMLTAFTDLEVYALPYEELRRLTKSSHDLALCLLEDDCDFISYLFYTSTSLAFSPCVTRICDILYLSLRELPHGNECIIDMTQALLTSLVGASRQQVERALKQLREEQIIATSRNQIHVLQVNALKELCSENVKAE